MVLTSCDQIMKIRDFQKCKVHSSTLRGFRITACQSWCNSQEVKKSTVFIGGTVFIWKYALQKKNLIFEKYQGYAPALTSCNLKPFKLEECILHFWKAPIFNYLVPAGHTYILDTQKAFLKIASFITVYLVGVNFQMHTTVFFSWRNWLICLL